MNYYYFLQKLKKYIITYFHTYSNITTTTKKKNLNPKKQVSLFKLTHKPIFYNNFFIDNPHTSVLQVELRGSHIAGNKNFLPRTPTAL